MKLKSILVFLLMLVLFSAVVPLVVFCFQLMFDVEFEDTWVGKMISLL